MIGSSPSLLSLEILSPRYPCVSLSNDTRTPSSSQSKVDRNFFSALRQHISPSKRPPCPTYVSINPSSPMTLTTSSKTPTSGNGKRSSSSCAHSLARTSLQISPRSLASDSNSKARSPRLLTRSKVRRSRRTTGKMQRCAISLRANSSRLPISGSRRCERKKDGTRPRRAKGFRDTHHMR